MTYEALRNLIIEKIRDNGVPVKIRAAEVREVLNELLDKIEATEGQDLSVIEGDITTINDALLVIENILDDLVLVAVPTDGVANDVLTKQSVAVGDFAWQPPVVPPPASSFNAFVHDFTASPTGDYSVSLAIIDPSLVYGNNLYYLYSRLSSSPVINDGFQQNNVGGLREREDASALQFTTLNPSSDYRLIIIPFA